MVWGYNLLLTHQVEMVASSMHYEYHCLDHSHSVSRVTFLLAFLNIFPGDFGTSLRLACIRYNNCLTLRTSMIHNCLEDRTCSCRVSLPSLGRIRVMRCRDLRLADNFGAWLTHVLQTVPTSVFSLFKFLLKNLTPGMSVEIIKSPLDEKKYR